MAVRAENVRDTPGQVVLFAERSVKIPFQMRSRVCYVFAVN